MNTITCILTNGSAKGEVFTYENEAPPIIEFPCVTSATGDNIELCDKNEIRMWTIKYILDVSSNLHPNIRYYILDEGGKNVNFLET